MAEAERFHPDTIEQWRDWLRAASERAHQGRVDGVWLVFWRQGSGHHTITYEESILEALCVGWIDGQSRPIDDQRSMLWFVPRNPRSPWSSRNKERVALLEREGRMLDAGRRMIEIAKASGTWTVLDDASALIEPPELSSALDMAPSARANWDAFPPSTRKAALVTIALAKRAETKKSRIDKIVEQSRRGTRPS